MSRHTLVALPGDGIGPEVIGAARALLDAVGEAFDAEFAVEQLPVGGASIDAHGVPLLPEVLERCREADAVLLGAVGCMTRHEAVTSAAVASRTAPTIDPAGDECSQFSCEP